MIAPQRSDGKAVPSAGPSQVSTGKPKIDAVQVSVVMACYNQAHFLAEAIESVRAQSYPHYEMVLVDDGSIDATSAVAQRYPDVRYIRQPHHGLRTARNRGIAEAHGEYLVILDADDRLLPDHLAQSLVAFTLHPEAAVVCGNYHIIGTEASAHVHCCDPSPDSFGALLAMGGFPGPPATAMFRTDAVRQMGGIRAGLPANGDYDLFLRIAQQYPLYCHHATVCEYRRHAGQRSKNSALMLRSVMAVLRWHRSYIRANPKYAPAYREAHRRFQSTYGEALFWETTSALKAGQLRSAAPGLITLLKWYPTSLLRLARRTLQKAFVASDAKPGEHGRS